MTYLENHEIFSANRKITLLRYTQPVDAFALGVKSLQKNSYIPEKERRKKFLTEKARGEHRVRVAIQPYRGQGCENEVPGMRL
jgi:hypothetical protein